MKPSIIAACLWVAVLGSTGLAQVETPETSWRQAELLETQGEKASAAQQFDRIAVEWPSWAGAARSALKAAEIYDDLGMGSEARLACERAMAVANSYWLQPALFWIAKTAQSAGDRDEALAVVERLHAEYPESAWTVRSRIVEALARGADPQLAEAAFRRELEAGTLCDQAVLLADEHRAEEALGLLDRVLTYYPDSAAALRALDAKGHLLIRLSRREEAMPIFADLLVMVGQTAPQARIVQRARMRLGALCRGSGRITEAEDIFGQLARNSADPAAASYAGLHLVGMHYERLRKPVFERRASGIYDARQVDHAGWAALRERCRALAEAPWCRPKERVRAELIAVESYCWERDARGAARAGDNFFAKYDGSEYIDQLASARLFVGIEVRNLKWYEESAEHFRWIIQHAPEVPSRVYLELWITLRRAEAPEHEIQEAEDLLMSVAPDSGWANYIRIIKRQEAQCDVVNAR